MPVDRFKLIEGPYAPPSFELGDVVTDELRGDVRITEISDGNIQWPKGRRLDQTGGHAGLILFADLICAVKTESNQAVCHWWGVTPQTVSKWRKALEIESTNEGTRMLRQQHGAEAWFREVRGRSHAKSRDTEADQTRREKIAESRRGKERPPGVMKKLADHNRGKKLSTETRSKMSKAHRKRGTRPPAAGKPWTAEEDALLEKFSVAEVVERTGRSTRAVYARRRKLGLSEAGLTD